MNAKEWIEQARVGKIQPPYVVAPELYQKLLEYVQKINLELADGGMLIAPSGPGLTFRRLPIEVEA